MKTRAPKIREAKKVTAQRPSKDASDAVPAVDPDVTRTFTEIAASFRGQRGIALPEATRRAFGSNAIKTNGKIFAMVSQGTLVVKLPAARVTELVAAGRGAPFDAGKGKIMKEWVALQKPTKGWPALAREACAFAGGSAPR